MSETIFGLSVKLEVPSMSTGITVRDINCEDKSWLRHEARQIGVSMEELVRRLIRENRSKTECRPKPSEAFARHFGEEHGVELPLPARCGYKPVSFAERTENDHPACVAD